MEAILGHLNERNAALGLDVAILGDAPDANIPGLKGPRAACHREGILESDAILVPLEDGDRCNALVAMGKKVIVIDLNPLSRSAQQGSITIVDGPGRWRACLRWRLKRESRWLTRRTTIKRCSMKD